jgi:hypothetical protein
MFSTTISLTELEISKNYISGDSLKEISFYFISHLKYLEKMTFTNNWIDSFCIEEFIRNALDNLMKISYIDLSHNFLDNDFLKAFDFYLRKSKYDRQEVTFDLSKNRFDCHLSKYKFHKYHEEENKLIDLIEVKPEKVYSLIHFMDNLAYLLVKLAK